MKVTTSMERTFKRRPDGLYQEYINHFIVFEDSDGNKKTKLDKTMVGRVFMEDTERRSFNGEVMYTFEDDGQTRRLIALNGDARR